ncbi:MAG: hypothetical protein RIR69_1555 [Actinomycetota bacterium]|jgi:alkylated DNA repair dioxygenase AlkB
MSLFVRDGEELLPGDGSARMYDDVLSDVAVQEQLRRVIGGRDVFMSLVNDIPWQSRTIKMFGKEHREPRMTAWFGDEGATYTYSGIRLSPLAWTDTLQILREVCATRSGASFNSVLLNLYRNGHDKMGWHADDESELGREPIITSLSLGATRRFRFKHRQNKTIVECELPHGSLLVMSGLTQQCWVHEVPRQTRVTEARINLTFRNIVL